MKVLDLRCANGHGFEGWFASEDDFLQQNGGGQLRCPLCDDGVITRLLSAPRLNISGARAPAVRAENPADQSVAGSPAAVPTKAPVPADPQAQFLHAVRELVARTEDVGPRFAEEARRIHYGEAAERAIRGQATPDERAALSEEGIETVSIPLPAALTGPLQ
jgi:hypothetical protein